MVDHAIGTVNMKIVQVKLLTFLYTSDKKNVFVLTDASLPQS